jgi:hypothetical protein
LVTTATLCHAQEPTPILLPSGAPCSVQAEQPTDPQADEGLLSGLYDPSIFIIEASGTWRQELAEGYYADYACELYPDKADAHDSRAADSLYTGVFWMSTKVELSDFLKKLLKDAPVAMDFDAGGEGICDNLTVHLLTGYEQNASQGYAIPGENGETQPPKGALAAEGGFVAVPIDAYLNVRASGAQGESLQHSDSQAADAEMSYVIHIEPDPKNELAERKATLYLYNSTDMSVTLEGIWRRIPGYPEDMLEHANTNPARQMLDKHMP